MAAQQHGEHEAHQVASDELAGGLGGVGEDVLVALGEGGGEVWRLPGRRSQHVGRPYQIVPEGAGGSSQ